MDKSFEDILNGDEPTIEQPEAQAAEPTPEAVAEEPKGPARDPATGKFAPKGEKEDAPPASSEPFEGKATLDERRRRQEAERERDELRQRLEALSNPPQEPADMFDDPEGFKQQFGSSVVTQASLNARLDTSEMLAAQAHDDFEEMRPKILALMEENPSLRQQVLTDRHPWNKAYQIAKNIARSEQLGATDVDSLRAAIRAEVEAELAAKTVAIPDSLSTAQSGRASASTPSSPPTLADILNSPR